MKTKTILDNVKWLFISFLFTTLSIFFSYWIFPSQASILSVTFTVMALTPPLYNLISKEEAIVVHEKKINHLKEYASLAEIVLILSIGIFLSFFFWYHALPSSNDYSTSCKIIYPKTCTSSASCKDLNRPDHIGSFSCSSSGKSCVWKSDIPCKESIFSLQKTFIKKPNSLELILGLILFSLILSLFFGAGAILIIVWDLSVIVATSVMGPFAFIAYIPQLLAFFLTGLAGVMISFAIIRHEWRTKTFFLVLRDSFILVLLSLLLALVSHFLLSSL